MVNKWVVTPDLIRLDSIVKKHYGNLDMFDKVLATNTHIESVMLTVGTVIELPEKVATVSEEVLW